MTRAVARAPRRRPLFSPRARTYPSALSWLIGCFISNIGPDDCFYVPIGILNPDGKDTLAIAVWQQPRRRGAWARSASAPTAGELHPRSSSTAAGGICDSACGLETDRAVAVSGVAWVRDVGPWSLLAGRPTVMGWLRSR